MLLEAVAPFDFSQSVAFLAGLDPCRDDHVAAGDRLVTGGYVDDDAFVATVRAGEVPATLDVDVEWLDAEGPDIAVGDHLAAFLSLSDDLGPLYAAARDDPTFSPVVETLYGLHHVRFPTPFEAACWAALSRRTPTAVARERKRALVETCGGYVERADGRVALFPTPERVLRRADALRVALDDDHAVRTLLAAAAAFADEPLSALDTLALRGRLEEVWGFGPWAAEFVTLRGFGRMEYTPADEYRLRTAVTARYGLDAPASDDDLRRLSDRYGPLAGYWAHYLQVAAGENGDLLEH
ncbi:DNA-3-methyladenine glycosylase family protein [Halomarina ordinaria]|uniref:DNA-3-methyladenine glycosylase family protein n=1 Tax=Halomarina ordinaria TaxID=3033939 RepID=A0ABD5U820_9EURY|nr:hypothetical protein [Halomarina sp. PSRA2]